MQPSTFKTWDGYNKGYGSICKDSGPADIKYQPLVDTVDGCNTNDRLMAMTMHQDITPVSKAFFSKGNIQTIQTALQREVLRRSNGKYKIEPQSEKDLLAIMRWVFNNSSRYLPHSVPQQVHELNRLVMAEAIPVLMTEVSQYLGYLRDASQLYDAISRPVNTDIKGERTTFMYNPGFYDTYGAPQ